MFSHNPYITLNFLPLLTELCANNYCQDGLQVYLATEKPKQNYPPDMFGHYVLQSYDINERPFFKTSSFGFWWDGIGKWWMGYSPDGDIVGQPFGNAFYQKDIFCPDQLSSVNWMYWNYQMWSDVGNDIAITCKCFHVNKNMF